MTVLDAVGVATLTVLTRAGTGRRFELTRRLVMVGRDHGCDVRLEGPRVGRTHAALRLHGGGAFYVQDLGSSGGTLVNDSPVTGPRELRPGDVVSFGAVRLRFDGHGRTFGQGR